MMKRRVVIGLAVLAMAVAGAAAGCGNGDDGDSPAATLEEPSTTAVAGVPTVPAEVPDVIDAAYVAEVMEVFDYYTTELARVAAGDPTLGEEFYARLDAIYVPEEAAGQFGAWEFYQPRLAADPGPMVTTVLEVISAGPECIFFSADGDLSVLLADPNDPEFERAPVAYLQFVRGEPSEFNPTPWKIALDRGADIDEVVADPCVAS